MLGAKNRSYNKIAILGSFIILVVFILLSFSVEKNNDSDKINLSLSTEVAQASSGCFDTCLSDGTAECSGTDCLNKWVCGSGSCDCSFKWVKAEGSPTTGNCSYDDPEEN